MKKMEIECPKCMHQWEYTGKSKHYINCPFCYKKINLKHMVEEVEGESA